MYKNVLRKIEFIHFLWSDEMTLFRCGQCHVAPMTINCEYIDQERLAQNGAPLQCKQIENRRSDDFGLRMLKNGVFKNAIHEREN